MEKFCSGLTAVVVGSARHKLTREITVCMDRINTPFDVCEDIYSAVATIAAAPAGTHILVVGRFAELAADNMRLFSLTAKDKKVFFCCLIEKWFAHLQTRLAAAVKAGAFVINSTEQLENIVKQCEASDKAVEQKAGGKDFASRIASLADNFFLTRAEQDALLGVGQNADTES